MRERSIWPRRFAWLEGQIRGERRPISPVASHFGFTKKRDRNNFPISHCAARSPLHWLAVLLAGRVERRTNPMASSSDSRIFTRPASKIEAL